MHVVQKISDFARETPDHAAIVSDLRPISYREFDERIRAMRRSLAARNIAPGGVAALWIDDIVVSWFVNLALRSLGHTTICIRLPAELAALGDMEAVAILTLEREYRPTLDPAIAPRAQRISLGDIDWTLSDPRADDPPLAAVTGDHVLLTSATTGRYKMVRMDAAREAAALATGRARFAEHYETHATTPAYALFNFGLWTGMGYGAPLVIWSLGATAIIHQGSSPWRALSVPGISNASVTPAFLAELMAAPAGAFERNDELEVSVIGGALSEALYTQTKARLTNRITTGVGSTESGGWARTRIESTDDLRWHRITPGQVVQIVGEDGELLPSGQIGQIRVPQVEGVDRYLNDAEATGAFFRDGYFYPGDLGMLDGKGRLALLGRVTDVLNVMGNKLPAAPIEAALEADLGVAAVCALSQQGPSQGEELHVFIETPSAIDETTLRAASLRHLTGFTIVRFHFVAKLPRNDMGKIERLRLRKQLNQGAKPA